VFPVTATLRVLWHDFSILRFGLCTTRSFQALPLPRQDRPAPATLEFSELLTRAKAAIEHALEQVQKTHTLLAESKEKRGSETVMGRGFMPR